MGLYLRAGMKRFKNIISLSFLLLISSVYGEDSSVFFIKPSNGDVVDKTFEVVFGINGMTLAPAGTYDNDTGHHHLIIDAQLPDLSMPVPATKQYLHFGKAQDRTMITLEPGKHTLQMILGDGNHIPHNPPIYSEIIEIEVKP
tara:strand:- start:3459 stop:3887 length:429 start_codon:yes stop_codon:yes gene_type:complete